MDQQAVEAALSDAIIEVSQKEFDRLSEGLTHCEIADRVRNALEELAKLSSGKGIPDYDDPWVALFYTTWYQPRQINVIYSMMKYYLNLNATNRNTKLFIIDFGCGTLAMQYGVALAFVDSAARGVPIPEIRILSMDSSKVMIDIGIDLWNVFKQNIRSKGRLSRLDEVCRSVKFVPMPLSDNEKQTKEKSMKKLISFADRNDLSQYECWVTAIHTVYEESLPDAKDWLQFLNNTFSPDSGFITYFWLNSTLVNEMSPFAGSITHKQLNVNIFTGGLPRIQNWRHSVSLELRKHGIYSEIISNFLKSKVSWDFSGINYLVYKRRS